MALSPTQGVAQVRKKLLSLLDIHPESLTPRVIQSLTELHEEVLFLDQRIEVKDREMILICQEDDACRRLTTIRGIGPTTATALVVSIGDINLFKNGRELAAWLGLVPRQCSSGNKQVLLGITKRGDKYIRKLLIHGARSGLSRKSILSEQESALIARRGIQKAYVAFANCLVPECGGIRFGSESSKEKLWDKYYMGAPKRQRQFVSRSKIVKKA